MRGKTGELERSRVGTTNRREGDKGKENEFELLSRILDPGQILSFVLEPSGDLRACQLG